MDLGIAFRRVGDRQVARGLLARGARAEVRPGPRALRPQAPWTAQDRRRHAAERVFFPESEGIPAPDAPPSINTSASHPLIPSASSTAHGGVPEACPYELKHATTAIRRRAGLRSGGVQGAASAEVGDASRSSPTATGVVLPKSASAIIEYVIGKYGSGQPGGEARRRQLRQRLRVLQLHFANDFSSCRARWCNVLRPA